MPTPYNPAVAEALEALQEAVWSLNRALPDNLPLDQGLLLEVLLRATRIAVEEFGHD